jgi:2-polyprenyl-3-methyl-5-hydroxy-6-metoxy-1,4-benzoquinol methylase
MLLEEELHQETKPFFSCIDYTVSNDLFELKYNSKYDILVTHKVPENLEMYYQSEDYISHTDSKKSLFDKVYQFVKNIALQKKLNLIESFHFQQKTILDVGAGTGDFLKFCKENKWKVTGVEPSEKSRNIASKKDVLLHEKLENIYNKEFDVISLWHVLEHVKDLESYIKTLHKLLTKEGKLIIAVPNFKSYDAKYYKEFWAAFDVPRHLWHFSQKGIETIFSQFGFKLEKTVPMKFDSYYVSLLSEKYKSKKMNPIKGFYRGFVSNLKAKQSSEYSSLIYVLKKEK